MKSVLITVKTVQKSGDDSEVMELTSEGEYGIKNGNLLITYHDEMMSDEYGKVNTAIEIDTENTVTITRTGAYRSKFVLEKGKRHNCAYTTPFGAMTMGFYGEDVKNELNNTGGNLYVKYTVDVNKSLINQNEIFVNVRNI